MLMDSNLDMCSAQAVNNGTSYAQLGTAIDLRPAGIADNPTLDISAGEPFYLVIELDTAITTADNYELALFTHTAATSIQSGEMLVTTGLLAVADLPIGRRWVFNLPKPEPGVDAYERYIAIAGKKAGSGTAAGSFTAFLTKEVNNWTSTNTRTD